MTGKIVKNLDRLLNPCGFVRKKFTWNRRYLEWVDVVDLQVDKSRTLLTLNAGVFDPEFYELCWERQSPEFIQEANCTVRTRIGFLFGQKDIWWDISDESAIEDVLEKCHTYALPFIDRMHSHANMEQFLEDSRGQIRYPPHTIYLATLKAAQGKAEEACLLLDLLLRKHEGAWAERITRVAKTLGCAKH